MTAPIQQDETTARIEELDHEELTEVGGGLNLFDDLYSYLKRIID